MCGIIGMIGREPAKERLIDALSRLEYRGYDSAGLALFVDQNVEIVRTVGKVAALRARASDIGDGTLGIGHTRWATHGGVTEANAHPHRCGRVTLVHNGIVENHRLLRERLARLGRTPLSETDTEIAAMLIDSLYEGDPVRALLDAAALLEGSFALVVLFSDRPDALYAIRRGSPLVAIALPGGGMVASDMTALLPYGRRYLAPPENALLVVGRDGLALLDSAAQSLTPEYLLADWDETAAQKDGYPHFMLKEIHEQPEALRRTILPRLAGESIDFSGDHLPDALLADCAHVFIVACGTAMHAGLAGCHFIERFAHVPTQVDIASEYRYRDPLIGPGTLVIVISQSGETADTLAALRLSKAKGAKTLAVVNCKGSTIARESDCALYTHAGPEIAVASTKAFTVQLAALYLIALKMAQLRGALTGDAFRERLQALRGAPDLVEAALARADDARRMAESIYRAQDLFYLGRGLDVAMAQEGSLKLKEICYLHSEAYGAGELKHGTISLIETGVPVFAFATQDAVYGKLCANVCEVRSRGGRVLLVTPDGFPVADDEADDVLRIPGCGGELAVFPLAVALQFLAYYCAVYRGLPVDQPRNLAKSVTVE